MQLVINRSKLCFASRARFMQKHRERECIFLVYRMVWMKISGDEESEKILFCENIWWRSQCYKSLYRELSWCFSGITWVTDSATGIFLHQRRSGKWVWKLFFVERLKKRAQIKFLDYDATLQHSTIFILALKMMMFCIPAFLLSSNFVH